MPHELIFVIGFVVFVLAMLAIDLGLFSKPGEPVTVKKASIMSLIWVSFALIFYGLIYKFGDQLHAITNFTELQSVNINHFHNLKLNPTDFAGSLDLYRQNLS